MAPQSTTPVSMVGVDVQLKEMPTPLVTAVYADVQAIFVPMKRKSN